MAMKTSETTLTTQLSVRDVGKTLQGAFARVKAESVEDVVSGSGALSAFDDRAAIEVVAQGGSLMGGQWAVQVYVNDRGDHREILLVALGDSGLTRAWHGARNTGSLSLSIKKRDLIADALR